jgi:hypothetical protein
MSVEVGAEIRRLHRSQGMSPTCCGWLTPFAGDVAYLLWLAGITEHPTREGQTTLLCHQGRVLQPPDC